MVSTYILKRSVKLCYILCITKLFIVVFFLRKSPQNYLIIIFLYNALKVWVVLCMHKLMLECFKLEVILHMIWCCISLFLYSLSFSN